MFAYRFEIIVVAGSKEVYQSGRGEFGEQFDLGDIR